MTRILGLVARGMFRTTARRVGYRGERPVLVVSVVVLVILAVANFATAFATTPIGDQLREASPAAALAVLWAQGAGIVVLVQNAGLGQSGLSRGTQLVPLTPLERVATVNVPLLFIAAVSCSTLVAPAVLLLMKYTDAGPLVALLASIVSIVAGCCVGFVCWAAAAWVCHRVRLLRGRTYPFSFVALVVVMSWSLPALAYLTGQGGPVRKPPLWQEVLLVWPAVYRYLRTGSFLWGATSFVAAALVIGVTLRIAYLVASILLKEEPPPPVRLPWNSVRRLPVFWLEFSRLVRSRRMISAAATTATMGVFGVLGAVLAAVREEASTVDVGPIIGVLVTIPAAQITLLARGLVTRSHAYQMLVGLRPGQWAVCVQAASFLLASLVIVPVMVTFHFIPGVDSLGLRVVMLYQLVLLATTAAFGFAVRPGRDNPAGEFGGLFLGSAVPAAVLTSLVSRYGADHHFVPMAAAALVIGMLPLPAIIERRRWRSLLGVDAPATSVHSPGMVGL